MVHRYLDGAVDVGLGDGLVGQRRPHLYQVGIAAGTAAAVGAAAVGRDEVVGEHAVGEVELPVRGQLQVVVRVAEVDALGTGQQEPAEEAGQAFHAELAAQEGPDAVQLFHVQEPGPGFVHGGVLHPGLQGIKAGREGGFQVCQSHKNLKGRDFPVKRFQRLLKSLDSGDRERRDVGQVELLIREVCIVLKR